MSKKRARTFTNFDRGIVDFRPMGVLVRRINTEVYGEGIQKMFASFTAKLYVGMVQKRVGVKLSNFFLCPIFSIRMPILVK